MGGELFQPEARARAKTWRCHGLEDQPYSTEEGSVSLML